MSRPGTEVTRGNKQDYATPREFIATVERELGEKFGFDAAALEANKVCEEFSSDSLNIDWPVGPLVWLNPPFGAGAKFAAKCAAQSARGVRIVGLFLAAVGSNWFAEHVHGKARVYFLRPRLTFIGESQPFNRDLVLVTYGLGEPGYDTWRWRP
jgi:phage N-6-adenine-methyltransferase